MSRRSPTQSRARASRDAIVEAAARLFEELGLERATTNRIAELAGVSVGSLYQYFPNKQALTTALYERETSQMTSAFLNAVAEVGTDDLSALTRAFVDYTVRRFEEKRGLYRVLMEEVPRVDGLEATHEIDRRVIAQLRLLLELGKARGMLATPNLDVAAMLVARTYRYNTLAVLREPLGADEREIFVDELTRMIVGYLTGG